MLITEQIRKRSLPNIPSTDQAREKLHGLYSTDYDYAINSSYSVFGSLSPIHCHCMSVGSSRKSLIDTDHQLSYEDSLSSSGSSLYLSDDIYDAQETVLENRHFEHALECGVFDGVQSEVRKERKKSFKRVSNNSEKASEEKTDIPEYLKRSRSRSFEFTPLLKSSKRKSDTGANMNKMRNELVASGINLFEEDNSTIDEVHEMQQRFYSGLKLTALPSITVQSIEDSSIIIPSATSRQRSLSLV